MSLRIQIAILSTQEQFAFSINRRHGTLSSTRNCFYGFSCGKSVIAQHCHAPSPSPLFIGHIEFLFPLVNPDNYSAPSIKRAGSRTRKTENYAWAAKTRFYISFARARTRIRFNEHVVSSRVHAPSALSLACLDDILAARTFTILSARALMRTGVRTRLSGPQSSSGRHCD